MTLIDKIKADMEAGTKGPWRFGRRYNSIVSDDNTGHDDSQSVGLYCGHLVCESVRKESNARRIARVPEMEAALLAAEDAVNGLVALLSNIMDDPSRLNDVEALTAYRKATGAV